MINNLELQMKIASTEQKPLDPIPTMLQSAFYPITDEFDCFPQNICLLKIDFLMTGRVLDRQHAVFIAGPRSDGG